MPLRADIGKGAIRKPILLGIGFKWSRSLNWLMAQTERQEQQRAKGAQHLAPCPSAVHHLLPRNSSAELYHGIVKSNYRNLLLCAASITCAERHESCRQRHLTLANGPVSRIMGGTYVGRSRFAAVPKEQPPRKLSGKRTSARPNRTLERGPSIDGTRRRDNNLRRQGQRGLMNQAQLRRQMSLCVDGAPGGIFGSIPCS